MKRNTAIVASAVTIVAAASIWDRRRYSTHDRLLKSAGSAINSATSADATIHTDHISPWYAAEGCPQTFGKYIPDLVFTTSRLTWWSRSRRRRH
jgi:hypothetical protein